MKTEPPFNTVAEQETEIVRVASRMLGGDVGIVAGSREITRTHFRSHSGDRDKDYLFLVGVESETQHFPLGDFRSKWDTQALVEKDSELTRYEDRRREQVMVACRNLVSRYGKGPNQSTDPTFSSGTSGAGHQSRHP